MLPTNLATRPFYNARAVQAILGAVALLVVAITLYNVVTIVRLTVQQRSLSARAVQAEREGSGCAGKPRQSGRGSTRKS